MARISLSHCSFSFKVCVFGWSVLLASISAALPVAFQPSPGRRETTGKHSVVTARLGLLLHHRVCKKPGRHSAGQDQRARAGADPTADPTFLSESRNTGNQGWEGNRGHRCWEMTGRCSHSQLIALQSTSAATRDLGKEGTNTHCPLFKISTDFLMCYFPWILMTYPTPYFFKVRVIINTSENAKGE